VLKLGGELLEDARRTQAMAAELAIAAAAMPVAVVHGGGREIDAALAKAGIQKRQVDGIASPISRRSTSSCPCWPGPSIPGLSRPSMPPADGPSA
jgi:acetylglutamate kinase